jgi:phosphodiesterase/alkaline phosphatase D-like protein
MHFIRFSSLEPRQKYTYQVRSGGSDDAWSHLYTFRAPYGHGTTAKSGGSNMTRVAIYGDMGNDATNNMGNLRDGCASGTIDAVVHMGDHCYNMGDGNDYHGDAYMQAFQGALATCPWLPVIGNHESTLGSEHNIDASTEERYLNETWGVIYGQDGAETETSTARTTATTSLGHLLTRSSFYGLVNPSTVW